MFGWGTRRSSGASPISGAPSGAHSEVDLAFMAELKGAEEQSHRRTQEECSRLAADFRDAIFCKSQTLACPIAADRTPKRLYMPAALTARPPVLL